MYYLKSHDHRSKAFLELKTTFPLHSKLVALSVEVRNLQEKFWDLNVVVVCRVSTTGQAQTGLGPRVYPFTTPDY